MGQVKGLSMLGSKTFIGHIAEAMGTVAEELVLSVGKGGRGVYAQFSKDLEIVEDQVIGLGPLGGIVSVLENVHAEFVLFSPCDTPFLTGDMCRLIASYTEGADGAVPMTGKFYLEPLHGIYRREPALAAFRQIARAGDLSPRHAFGLMNIRFVPESRLREIDPELDSFWNINSKDDLELAKRKFESRG